MASRKTWELFTLGPWRGTWRPALEGHAASELALAAWPQAGRGGRHSGGDVGSEALKFTPRARTAGPEQTALALAGLRTVIQWVHMHVIESFRDIDTYSRIDVHTEYRISKSYLNKLLL